MVRIKELKYDVGLHFFVILVTVDNCVARMLADVNRLYSVSVHFDQCMLMENIALGNHLGWCLLFLLVLLLLRTHRSQHYILLILLPLPLLLPPPPPSLPPPPPPPFSPPIRTAHF